MKMGMKEVIAQLRDLALNQSDFVKNDSDTEIFSRDVVALNVAADELESIENLSGGYVDILKKVMELENVSQTELASRMGVSRQTVNGMLTRNSYGIRYDSFDRALRAMGYEPSAKNSKNRSKTLDKLEV